MGNLFCKTDDNGKNATAGNSDPDFHQAPRSVGDSNAGVHSHWRGIQQGFALDAKGT